MSPSPRTRKIAAVLAGAALAAVAFFFVLTSARPSGRELPEHLPDPARGEVLYHAGSCVSCHKASVADGVDGLPAGGVEFPTPVGTFWPGNLTPDAETGLGNWTAEEFVDAMTDGVSPDGRHYFPAFPYPSYRTMPVEDILDLWAFLNTLEPVRSPGRAPDVPALVLARRSVGLWKRLALEDPGFTPDPEHSDSWNRGAYLSNGPGHCGECHTPRNALMILDPERAYEGGPHPRGEGMVPGLLDLEERGRYSDAADLVLALQFGETLGYDKLSSGGMADVQMNLAKLPEDELLAMAEYLLSLQ
ncbi:MAG: cytochrome c [Thermoanaerobaculales bacterium]|nr:cytochrome c [Thermoanaerobaculales bacterium]